jgi:sorting nexin-29
MAFDDVHLDSTQPTSNNNEDNDGYKSPSDALSILSVDTNSGHEDSVTKLTPMKNSEIGALIPLGLHGSSQDECDVMSEDSMSIKSFGDDQDYASALSSITATPQPPPVPPPPFHQNHVPVPVYYRQSSAVSSVASAHNSTLSREDLKQALLSVMERKEELQEQYQSLKKVLQKESTVTSNLKQDLDESNRKSKENSDKMQARINSILRENELLKHQLKKYVGAVQKLRDGPQAHETLAQLEGNYYIPM